MRTTKNLALIAVLTASLCGAWAAQQTPDLLAIPKVSKDQVICFALYTTQDHVLKLTAQFYPLEKDDPRVARLEIRREGPWQEVARAPIIEPGWVATFRVEPWDMTRDAEYRVTHGAGAYYCGTVKRDPVDKEEIVVAAFTGNSIYPGHGGDIPRTDIVENIKKIKPDLLFFSGDQVYDHRHHYAYWLKFGRDFGDIIRDIPTVTIPDDHDVGQANLWGEGGRKSYTAAGHDGGYFMPVEYVEEVHRAQTSHLPDPYDPTPIERGISVYYTALRVGRVSFAIIEDRKFKTGPEGLIPQMGPRPDHINDPSYDRRAIDVPEARLLGPRQLAFLRAWGTDWEGCDMKAVLSQTIFCGGAHIHGKIGGRLLADMDSNGWPQSGRNRALAEIRRCFAIHIAGDQHLGTIFHHGINDWEDACYSFCVPSIANLYLRWWDPLEPGQNRRPGAPEYTGRHYDGFGNKVTCVTAANPSKEPNGGDKLTTRAAGFGIVRFNVATRKITLECWPRNVDVDDPSAEQYPGWPFTLDQTDNYGRQPIALLPALQINGPADAVVQVVDEDLDEIVYTLRIRGRVIRPRVFHKGYYTIHVWHGDRRKSLYGVHSIDLAERKTIRVDL